MDGNIFFTLQRVNCTQEFLLASYHATLGVRTTVYALSALQAALLLAGAALNGACLATLLKYPLSSEVNGHFVSFAVCDSAFLLFNLLDTVSHCVENSGPLADGPGPFGYIAFVHPIAWTARSVAYTAHCWQTVALSVLKCLRVSRPLSALSEGRLSLLIATVWLYSLATSVPPILLFRGFVSILLADCAGDGFRVAGSGYFAYFSSNQTASPETSVATIPPTFVAVNSSLLPACICLVCSLIIVRRLRDRTGSVSGQQLDPWQPQQQQQQQHHHHHHRHYEATVARQGREATRSVLLSVNSFLVFQIPMVMWTLFDRWFWPALQPSSFSLLVVIINTVSQMFFAIDLSLCLHSNRRFRASFKRLLVPLSRRAFGSSSQQYQQSSHHQPHQFNSSEHLEARRKQHCQSSGGSDTPLPVTSSTLTIPA